MGESRNIPSRPPAPRPTATDVSLGELQRTLDRIEARQERVVDDHELRLRRVERWVYTLPPTIVTAAAAIIIALVRGGP